MKSHRVTRVAAFAVVLGGAAAGMAVIAPSAFAEAPGCHGNAMIAKFGGALTSPSEVYATVYTYWNGCSYTVNDPDSISKYVTGVGWEKVASGSGTITYSCTGGSALYTTSATGSEEFSCG